MSFNLVQEDYRAGSFSREQPIAEVAQPETPAAAKITEPEGPLASLLELMRERLAKILGPMASFIFTELQDKWQQQGAVDFARIDELLSAIDTEIADEEKSQKYRSLIGPELQAFQEG
jgi:hypothetical protein